MQRLSTVSVLLLYVLITGCGGEGGGIAGRINAVENSLIPAVIGADEEPPLMNLEDRMRHYKVPGVGIAVINNGRVEWAKGYGVIEAGATQAVNENTVFQACSISKPVSVTGIMLLAQSGFLDITRNVNDYLTSWLLPDNVYTIREKVTVERLMSHTGGTSVGGFDGYAFGEAVPTLTQTLQGLSPANSPPVKVIFTPGSQWTYSGGGMEVLHLMTQDMTGMPFRDYMQHNLFTPLGMSRSDFAQPLTGPLEVNAAIGHDVDGIAVPGGWHTYPELVAAGLWTTPSDLGRLLVEIMNASRGYGDVLEKETVDDILTLRPESDFGLGFLVETWNDDLIFKHTGSNQGYKTYFMGFRDRGQGVAVMTNGENGSPLMYEIVRSIGRVYGWPAEIEGAIEARLVDVPLPNLRSYVGSYVGTYKPIGEEAVEGIDFQVYLDGSDLMLRLAFAGGSGRMDLYPLAYNEFLIRSDLEGTLVFDLDAQGNAIGFSIPQLSVAAEKI
jgi:CubicO group peptidase (beta-lactamase class C family)